MDVDFFLDSAVRTKSYKEQIVNLRRLEGREAEFGSLRDPLSPEVASALKRLKIDRLYLHQTTVIDLVREGKSVAVVTGTASGKTLCYTIPVVEEIVRAPVSTMLFLYPTKALAQDQLRAVERFAEYVSSISIFAGTYDGDTPSTLRRKLRDKGNIVLTNPDMLHQGILPTHARWARFFTNLKYVVIDEIHAYRGVFGSHLANVIRRLKRVCAHHGSSPQFICSSATIANPGEHAERICGGKVALVNRDGAPRGPRTVALWNPPQLDAVTLSPVGERQMGGNRKSALGEAVDLMTSLVKQGIQTIAFVRTRLAAELILRSCRDRLEKTSRRLSQSVCAYRGGYLAEERREIERKLASREILGVASTNALELGIDIGSLDACILVGYPGTIASFHQQSGRAGRTAGESLVFLVAKNAPVDQYLMNHTEYLFEQSPEHAVVDPDNPHIVVGHLRCAAYELPLTLQDVDLFGEFASAVLELLEEDGDLRRIRERWYYAQNSGPAADVNLRNIAGPVYTIQEGHDQARVIGTIDELSALAQLHDHAVYLHGADTYFVEKLDIEMKTAIVKRMELDYYTQSIQNSQIRIDETENEETWHDSLLGYGDVTVTTTIPMFTKVRFHSRDSLGFEKLELPPQSMETVAVWFAPPEDVVAEMMREGLLVGDALVGVANVLLEVAPLYIMCDPQDIGTVIDSSSLGRNALFLHDKYPGGMGYSRRAMDFFEELMNAAADIVRECSCPDGCPSCVGSAVPASATGEQAGGVRGRIPDKKATRFLLDRVLAR